jgi:tetratricopeptide (TPR) repeat protein
MPRAWEPAAAPPKFEAERWVDEGPVEGEPSGVREAGRAAVVRSQRQTGVSTGRRRPKPVADDVAAALERVVSPNRAKRLASFLAEAAVALNDERLDDAHRLVGPVLREAPDIPQVRELAGQIAYRRGEWKRAIRELEAFRMQRPQDVVVLPVLADCYRALGRHGEVDRLWQELREASPHPEVMAEGRIVAAGSLADRGEPAKAIALLERATGRPRRVADHHLRQWYVMADLYDRSGEPVQARRYFARIADVDRDFFDVLDRLAALGR